MKTYLDLIENETGKPKAPNCFLGAWYHKQFSSKDHWLGIEGTITLPKVDIKRFNEVKNLDTPSIYMGGHAKYESDVGLSYMTGIIEKDGVSEVTKGGIAFRPFWRYISDQHDDIDVGSYDYENRRFYNASNLTPNQSTSNCYAHYSGKYTEYYYLPGDKVKIVVTYPKKDFMQLKIEVLEVSTYPETIQKRKDLNWKEPVTFVSPLFSSPQDNETNLIEFKRVNAIDQSGNEGNPTINTKTEIRDAIWHSVYLYREIDGEVVKVPFNNERSAVMNCPTVKGFEIQEIDARTGGSVISIIPGNVEND